MADPKKTQSVNQWTSLQAYALAVICLLVGVTGGWFVRGSQLPVLSSRKRPVQGNPQGMSGAQPTAEQIKHTAEKQVEALLAQRKADPNNPELLTTIGNAYYDTPQFPTAIEHYQRALQGKPDNASVRTDMATACWYTGNADPAIAELNKAFFYEPNKPNVLFNLGIVEWQEKTDVDSALSAWQKLLHTNPNYENKAKLLDLMTQVKKHSGIQPGTQIKALPQ